MSPKPSESKLRGELRVSEATERGRVRAGRILHFEPEKNVSDAWYFEQRLLEYDFLQIAMGQDDNIELWAWRFRYIHLIISERAPLEMTYISMSPKAFICEENCERAKQPSGGGGGRVWEGVSPSQSK